VENILKEFNDINHWRVEHAEKIDQVEPMPLTTEEGAFSDSDDDDDDDSIDSEEVLN